MNILNAKMKSANTNDKHTNKRDLLHGRHQRACTLMRTMRAQKPQTHMSGSDRPTNMPSISSPPSLTARSQNNTCKTQILSVMELNG